MTSACSPQLREVLWIERWMNESSSQHQSALLSESAHLSAEFWRVGRNMYMWGKARTGVTISQEIRIFEASIFLTHRILGSWGLGGRHPSTPLSEFLKWWRQSPYSAFRSCVWSPPPPPTQVYFSLWTLVSLSVKVMSTHWPSLTVSSVVSHETNRLRWKPEDIHASGGSLKSYVSN